ncbi:MAG: HNH endonuclease [Bryobacteraceae bacterium]|jgi:hypothetical protein
MRTTFAVSLFVASALALSAAEYGHASNGALLPDRSTTPGAVLTTNTAKVCKPGYAGTVRNVPASVKNQAYAEYGAKRKAGVCCEVDHLISLELGGSNSLLNLWAEPYEPRPGAHEKDLVENYLHYLHREVCAGRMDIQAAQDLIRTDWTKALAAAQGK